MERTLEKKMGEAKASAATLNALGYFKNRVRSSPAWSCRVGFWIVAVYGFSVSIISEESVPSSLFKSVA
ncbi:unnamed protein product [Brassica rapa]|uniref:Uncharacterized protein n=2 Tax=Brassica TaxID=3705 RepID=A0A3P6ALX3_BRACM|nr:unnamed protein product [Brassica napus]CAG7895733.1 unnamed protein product [Brassica rapa]VDC92457.1 unnamed protein product [Brassica rapa]